MMKNRSILIPKFAFSQMLRLINFVFRFIVEHHGRKIIKSKIVIIILSDYNITEIFITFLLLFLSLKKSVRFS